MYISCMEQYLFCTMEDSVFACFSAFTTDQMGFMVLAVLKDKCSSLKF